MFIINIEYDQKLMIKIVNPSGLIEHRVSARILENPDKILKRVRKLYPTETPYIVITNIQDDTIYIARHERIRALLDDINKCIDCIVANDSQSCSRHDSMYDAHYYIVVAIQGRGDQLCRPVNYDVIKDLLIDPERFKEFENDLDVFLNIVDLCGSLIEYASDTLKMNRKLVKRAVRHNRNAIRYVNPELYGDLGIMKIVLKNDITAYRHASMEIKMMPKYGKLVVNKYGTHLRYVPREISNYREICLIAMKNDRRAYESLPKYLKRDREILDIVFNIDTSEEYINYKVLHPHFYTKYNHEELIQLTTKFNELYTILPYSMRCNIEFIKIIIETKSRIYTDIIRSIPRKSKFQYIALIINNIQIYRPECFTIKDMKNIKIYKKFANTNIYSQLPIKQRRNRNFILATSISNIGEFNRIPIKYREDREIMINVASTIQHSDKLALYNSVSYDIQNNTEFIKNICHCENIFPILPDKFKQNNDIITHAISMNSDIFCILPVNMRNNKDFAMIALKKYVFPHSCENFQRIYNNIGPDIRSDKDIIIAAITSCRNVYWSIPEHMKVDHYILKYIMDSSMPCYNTIIPTTKSYSSEHRWSTDRYDAFAAYIESSGILEKICNIDIRDRKQQIMVGKYCLNETIIRKLLLINGMLLVVVKTCAREFMTLDIMVIAVRQNPTAIRYVESCDREKVLESI
jgi:hypothetical protein